MAGNDKRMIMVRKLGDKLYIDVNIVVSGRKLMRWMLFIGLVIILIILAAQGEPSIDWRELLIGLIQSAVLEYLNRK